MAAVSEVAVLKTETERAREAKAEIRAHLDAVCVLMTKLRADHGINTNIALQVNTFGQSFVADLSMFKVV